MEVSEVHTAISSVLGSTRPVKLYEVLSLSEVLWHTKDNRNGKLALQEGGNMYFCLKENEGNELQWSHQVIFL